MSVESWIRFWQNHDGPGYHDKDRQFMESSWGGLRFEVKNSAIPDFPLCKKDRGLLHPRLRPVPYVGDVRTATLIFAMLNPTVDHKDYSDDQQSSFHELLRENRMQENVRGCFAVDEGPRARSWSGYFRSIFNSAVHTTVKSSGRKKEEVWAELKRCLAILELVPYYSQNGSMLLQNRRYSCLPSVKLALEAMEEIQKRPGVTIVCRWQRGADRWNVNRGAYVLSATRRGLSADAKERISGHLKRSLERRSSS